MVKFLLLICCSILVFPHTIASSYDTDFANTQFLIEHTKPLKSSIDMSIDLDDLECLAQNIYFEAGTEPTVGKLAVALVTLNRVKHSDFPNNICDVVYQSYRYKNGIPIKYKCQFSWYCDGKPDIPYKGVQWYISVEVARVVMKHHNTIPDITMGAKYYHAVYVNPYWNKHFTKVIKIGRHIFYQ